MVSGTQVLIGYEISEQLEVKPAMYFVQVSKREKPACSCGRGGVMTALVAKRIIEKGLVSDSTGDPDASEQVL